MNKHHITINLFFLLLFSFVSAQADEITGMYSYMADAGLFLECGEGKKRLPVAMEGDNISLEKAYLKNRYMPGKALLVNIKGYHTSRPKMEGDGEQQVIFVEQFLAIHQQERCTGVVPSSSLSNTYWKLVELNGRQLNGGQGVSQEIHFIIHQNNLIRGFSGCNKFSGNITYTEDHINIGPLMSTRKTCPAVDLENTIKNIMTKTDRYHIKGESLDIYNDNKHNGAVSAKFIAIYF